MALEFELTCVNQLPWMGVLGLSTACSCEATWPFSERENVVPRNLGGCQHFPVLTELPKDGFEPLKRIKNSCAGCDACFSVSLL